LSKNNQAINETSNAVFIEDPQVLPVEEDLDFTSLNATLTEIRKTQGVIGYILRSKTLATVNLAEPDKIVDYALLTSQTIDHANSLAQLFNVCKVESMLLEGKNVKTLSYLCVEYK
jgi:predicted regulator of Ras-like GTPase activity (Roadblock/LC7/MglB family)